MRSQPGQGSSFARRMAAPDSVAARRFWGKGDQKAEHQAEKPAFGSSLKGANDVPAPPALCRYPPRTPFETRKVFGGVASHQQMYAFLNRHAQAHFDEERTSGRCYAGEWSEIAECDHRMFEILPPLFYRGNHFAMREFIARNVTSVFFALITNGRASWLTAIVTFPIASRSTRCAPPSSRAKAGPTGLRRGAKSSIISGLRPPTSFAPTRITGSGRFPGTPNHLRLLRR